MDDNTRQKLLHKNENMINMVIERAKRDFPDEIAIIGLTGSFSTEDYHEKSDLDLIIINNTNEGWGIAKCFILEDVGYDLYCTPWEPSIEDKATLKNPGVSCLVDLHILYCADQKYMDKWNAYKKRALDALAQPIGKECIARAKDHINKAKQEFANVMLLEDLGGVRNASCNVLYNLVNALTNLNNTYFKRGVKRYLEEICSYEYVPHHVEALYMAMVNGKSIEAIRSSAHNFLKAMVELYEAMYEKFVEKPIPTYENLTGTYEELWCNYRNKVLQCVVSGDKSYAYHVAMGAQHFLDEMTEDRGTIKIDLLQHFDSDNLGLFKDKFLEAMEKYLEEYTKVGKNVVKYETFDELYRDFM